MTITNSGTGRRRAVLVAVLLGALVSLVGPARPAAAASYVPISGSGSTLAYNAIHTWAANVRQYGVVVNYAGIGSTSGRNQFTQGVVDWAASDTPYGPDDSPPSRGFAYLPDVAVSTTFAYNLKVGTHNITNLRLSGDNIAKIFTGVLTRWDDPAIAADNPGVILPSIGIVPVVRSDPAGSTAQLTQWMTATEGPYWTDYCARLGRNPCTATAAYPVLAGSGMIGQPGDLGVTGYVRQSQANGAIGYVEYPYAIQAGLPVAKVLNAAGYYTEPTAGHVGVSLLKAKINLDQNDPDTYLTQDLSEVYTDPDPRTYELSWYSYLIVPTDTSAGFNASKGYTLGDFGRYLLCDGQSQVNTPGYSALPINLVEAGFAQLQRIPGASVPTATEDIIASCHNPTFSTDGTNTLALNDPQPQPCDRQGPTQCTTDGGPARTAVSLSAPAIVPTGGNVTLTATVAPGGASGQIVFAENITPLGPPVTPVSGVALLSTTTLAPGTHRISASFLPADRTAFQGSTSNLVTVVVTDGLNQAETVNLDIPHAEGIFVLTVSDTPVQLGTAVLSGDYATFEATGQLGAVTVSDTRYQSQPGWTVSGQVGDFSSGGHTFAGYYLGWTPLVTTQNPALDVVAGAPVLPGTVPGLIGGGGLASAAAHAGLGAAVLGANLDLRMPSSTAAGEYAATLTITAVE